MATRPTGQIEEGPPGFTVTAIKGRGVSGRFVLIMRPTDRRLITQAVPTSSGGAPIRAKILGNAPIVAVESIFATQPGPNRNGRKW